MNNAIAPFHATILIGSEEKRRAKALEIAQAMVCTAPEGQRPCGVCRDCRKTAEGIHPDVIPVERFMEAKDVGGELKVGPIRDLRSDAFIRPNEARSKVYLIENAQNMNQNAQNALLKVLEEGPPYAAFLLMTDRAGALLETIRSRCAAIHVGEDDNGDETDAQALAFAQLLVSGDEFQRADFLVRFENAKPDRPTQEHFLNGLEELLNDAVIGSATGRFHSPAARSLAAARSSGQLLDWAEIVRKGQDMLPFHVAAGHLLGWLAARLN